jgi:hypothetical protein
VLQVGPAGLGHRGHVEAALRGDEVDLSLAKSVVEDIGAAFEIACVVRPTAVALLRGLD